MKIAHLLSLLGALPALASAALDSSKVVQAEAKKTNTYLKDGMVVGGSADVHDVVVEDIRRARNIGYERVVVDLKNPADSEGKIAPFFQVAVEPDRKRIVISVFGKAKAGFNAKKIQALFAKSAVIRKLELLPSVDPGVWIFAMVLNEAPSVEVFQLSSPARLILDLKLPSGTLPENKNPATTSRAVPHEKGGQKKSATKKAAPANPSAAASEHGASHESLPSQAKDGEDSPSGFEGVPEAGE